MVYVEEIIGTHIHGGMKKESCKQKVSCSYTYTHLRTIKLCIFPLMGKKKWEERRCIKRNQCNFNEGVLTLGKVRRNGAKQGLCTVIHMVCGFMRGQMVPLKQEVIDIMTWPTTECGCMCVLNEYVCLKIRPLSGFKETCFLIK